MKKNTGYQSDTEGNQSNEDGVTIGSGSSDNKLNDDESYNDPSINLYSIKRQYSEMRSQFDKSSQSQHLDPMGISGQEADDENSNRHLQESTLEEEEP